MTHERRLRATLNKIKTELTCYNRIVNTINENFIEWPWQNSTGGIEVMFTVWRKLFLRYKEERWDKPSYEVRLLNTVAKIVIIYGQFEIIKFANPYGKNMNWQSLWERLKMVTAITKCMSTTLTAKWLQPRLGSIASGLK